MGKWVSVWVYLSSLLWYLDLNAKILAQASWVFCLFVLLMAPVFSFPKDLAKSSQVVFELNVKLLTQESIFCFFGPTRFFFPTALPFPSVSIGCAPQVSHSKEVANIALLICEVGKFC